MNNNQSEHTASYWLDKITRAEYQKVQDDNAKQINALTEASHKTTQLLASLTMTLAFLADKAGVKPEEFTKYMELKQAEFAKLQAGQALIEPPVQPKSVLEN